VSRATCGSHGMTSIDEVMSFIAKHGITNAKTI
jgi:hypothetical protein